MQKTQKHEPRAQQSRISKILDCESITRLWINSKTVKTNGCEFTRLGITRLWNCGWWNYEAKPDLAFREHNIKGKWGFCKDCDWTWKLNAVGKWLVMMCSCEQKQVTWVRLSDWGKNMAWKGPLSLLKPSCCEVTVLTTTPPCSPLNHTPNSKTGWLKRKRPTVVNWPLITPDPNPVD